MEEKLEILLSLEKKRRKERRKEKKKDSRVWRKKEGKKEGKKERKKERLLRLEKERKKERKKEGKKEGKKERKEEILSNRGTNTECIGSSVVIVTRKEASVDKRTLGSVSSVCGCRVFEQPWNDRLL